MTGQDTPDKCVVLKINQSSNNSGKRFYNIDETRLKTVETEKDLGAIFGSNISFESQRARIAGLMRTYIQKIVYLNRSTTFRVYGAIWEIQERHDRSIQTVARIL